MPAAKAMLPALNMGKVKAVSNHDDHSVHDVSARTHRRVNTHRDQSQSIPASKASPYTAPRLTKPVSTTTVSQLSGNPTSNSGHAMIQTSSNFSSVYTKPIVIPALLLPPTLDNNPQDGPVSARGALNSSSAASQFMQMRGALTARGAPPHNQYGSSSSQQGPPSSQQHQQGYQQQQQTQPAQQQSQQPVNHSYHSQQSASRRSTAQHSHTQQGYPGDSSGGGAGAAQGTGTTAAGAGASGTSPAQHQRSASRASTSSESAETSTAWESGAITPAQALKRYSEYLTSFEQSEILDYPQVFFVGRSGAPKIKGNPHSTKANFGYDDDRGDYTVIPHDHLAYRYEVLGILGKGSFGQVVKVHDFKTNTLKAVKVIRNKKRFHHQALVELKVLQHLKQCDPSDEHHVIHMQEHFVFRNHLCITFEMLSVNLYEFVKQNNFAGLSQGLIRRFAHQILVTLKYLKSLRIIHCDLKPENILLRQPNRSLIKVIDFGSSCFDDERIYTYIQSRFYRSPEVILGLTYGCEIDMWSFGAILAELYTGYPLFPGEDEQEQLACIMEVVGQPPTDLVASASRKKLFFDANGAPRLTANSQGKMRNPGTRPLPSVLRGADPDFLDLLLGCLRWDPQQRLTPEQALAHKWITGDQAPAPSPRQATSTATSTTPRGTHQHHHTQQPQLLPTTPRAAALQPSISGGGAQQAHRLLAAHNAVAASSDSQPAWANNHNNLLGHTGANAGAGKSGHQQQSAANTLGPLVKPLNLTGVTGFAATSAAKPPSTPRSHQRFDSVMTTQPSQLHQQLSQSAQLSPSAANMLQRKGHQHAPMLQTQASNGRGDNGAALVSSLSTGLVTSPPGAPTTPGKQPRGLAPSSSLLLGSPTSINGDTSHHPQLTGISLPALTTPR